MDVASPAPTPIEQILTADEFAVVRRGLASLGDRDRDILVRRFQGERWAAIGATYGVSAQAVQLTAKRTLTRLTHFARVATEPRS